MGNLIIKNVSSLEKILPRQTCDAEEYNSASALIGEEFCYQVAFKYGELRFGTEEYELEIDSDIKDCISVYNVRCVPVMMNHFYSSFDGQYITDEPSLIPDYLEPYINSVKATPRIYLAIWVSVRLDESVRPGEHKIRILFKRDEHVSGVSEFVLDVIGAKLPALDIPSTNWFHADCIASYHGCEVFSERHFELIDSYMKVAREHGINMLLTPVFTPPLDTKVGSERPTVQLVDVFYDGKKYSFSFDKLTRWLELCRKNKIEYIEISHLYTQWGAEHAPKIVVTENGEKIKKFGWDTDSMGEDYKDFISQLMPPLTEYLEKNWDKEKVYFHISDEPHANHITRYGAISEFIKPLISGFKQMDAISDYELYRKGYIETPVVSSNSINNFLDKNIGNLWMYYCCSQGVNNLSNRFIAMPSSRNRILGIQLYKYDVKGFLQWGYNFYYSRLSTHLINPFLTNDADYGFPAGDSFSVYPCQNGALPSLRLKVFSEGLQDMMAMKLLESLSSRERVMELVNSKGEITFSSYPQGSKFILDLRRKVNDEIKKYISK